MAISGLNMAIYFGTQRKRPNHVFRELGSNTLRSHIWRLQMQLLKMLTVSARRMHARAQ